MGEKMGGYQLLGLIARGGMGAVYEALELQLERKVALKVIAPPNPDDHDAEELVQRFMQEARTLARINHPNVITIYAIDSSDGIPFITMELVAGISLKELLQVSFLSADLAAPMFIQLLEGLHCLHENRIVHRDLKPHNIMVRVDGQIKILDFGIAKEVDQGTFTNVGVVVGSLAYMAPEVKMGVAATERSDLWNAGAIFYECLTGKALPRAMSENSNSKEIPYAANSSVPLEMRSIINKLCAYKPMDRYENAMQAIEDLRRYQRSRPPLSAEAMATFGRKVDEIIQKRKGNVSEAPTPDVKPVQASTFSHEAHEVQSNPSRREVIRTSRSRRKKQTVPPWLIAGGITVVLATAILFKQKPAELKSTDQTPEEVVETPRPEPLQAEPVHVEPPLTPQDVAEPEPATQPIEQKKQRVVLSEPEQDSVLWIEPAVIPTLKWSRDLKANEYEIEIATDRNFRNTVLRERVSGRFYRPPRILPEDKYYWRLYPLDSQMPQIGPARFTLSYVTPVELISPPNHNTIAISVKEKNGQIQLSWRCKEGIDQYQIQIGSPSTFSGGRNRTTKYCYWRESQLAPGRYRWRVRSLGEAKQARVWSEGREFTIKREAAPSKPSQPTLAKPKLGESTRTLALKFKSAPRDLASLSSSAESMPELRWQAVPSAKQYLLQISSESDFSSIHSEHTLNATSYSWRQGVPGTFFWRVAALNAESRQGPFSDVAKLRVLLPAPKLKSRYKFEAPVDGDRQVVSWQPIPLAEKYVVQLGPTRKLAQSERQIVSAAKFAVPNQHGMYFARVAAADASGATISQFSSIAAITLEPVAVLDPPTPQLPTPGAKAVARSGRLSITFQWSKVPKAEKYVLEIAPEDSFSKPERITSPEPTVLLKKVELGGRLYWRVRAENKDGVSNWSNLRHFEVKK